MHIVILADPIDNQSAGVHVYTKNLIENLLKIDSKNQYSFIHERENDFFKGKKHYILPRKKHFGAGTKRKFYDIPKLLKKIQPDLVFEPSHIGPFFVPEGCKKATMIHDLTPILFPQFHIKRSVLIHRFLFKKVLKNSDLLLCASQNTKMDIKNYSHTTAPIKVIPLGIDHLHDAEEPNRVVKTPYLLYLGTIEPRKNLEMLIGAFEELKLEHKLVLAGEIGWKAEEIVKKARRNSNILMTKFIDEDERASLYTYADALIYPSVYEGFGFPPLEALFYGCPVISSNGGSLGEMLRGKALLFEPNDKETLKRHILKVLKSKTIIDKNFPRKFHWEKTAKETLKAFETICKK